MEKIIFFHYHKYIIFYCNTLFVTVHVTENVRFKCSQPWKINGCRDMLCLIDKI